MADVEANGSGMGFIKLKRLCVYAIKTISAVNRFGASSLKWNLGRFLARITNIVKQFFLTSTPSVALSELLLALIPTVWAAGRLILKSLLRIKGLFTRSEHKVLSALLASNGFVLEFHEFPPLG